MQWIDFFHSLVIPFLGGFALTLSKLIADQKLLSFDESNDIALDMVLLGVGALGAFYIKGGTVEATIDAGVGDAFLRRSCFISGTEESASAPQRSADCKEAYNSSSEPAQFSGHSKHSEAHHRRCGRLPWNPWFIVLSRLPWKPPLPA